MAKKAGTRTGIKDIAVRAGVSIATVSNTMRNPDRVSVLTREKVLAAIKEVGYIPNKFGVGLRTSKSHSIVVIIPDVADSFNFGIIKAIESVAQRQGYSVLLGNTQGSQEREREYAAMAASGQADGIILFSHHFPFDIGENKPVLDDLPPMVNSCEKTNVEGIPFVNIDNVQAAKDAAQHLIDYGHRNIAVITGNMDSPSSQERLKGFRQAMSAAGLALDEDNVIYSEYTAQGGEDGANKLLKSQSRPTAIFCFCDEIALGCIYAIRQHNLEVPGDISVIGFDNIPFAKYMASPLTTISQPTEEIGRTSATLLLDLIMDKKPEFESYILEHELVVRSSTRRIS